MQTVIVGGPSTGKTTRADALGEEVPFSRVRHTDDLIDTHGWSEASLEVSTWFDEEGEWIIEGVATARALRKWLAANPEGKPCDRIIVLSQPKVPLSGRQMGMLKGVFTVFTEIAPTLQARGVVIEIEETERESWE